MFSYGDFCYQNGYRWNDEIDVAKARVIYL